MEDVKSNSAQNLGIAALITGIITFVLAVIPCVGILAIVPGIISIVLASVGLSQASRNDSPKGVIIAGLVIGIVAVMISFSQVFVAGRLARNADKWPHELKNVVEDVREDVLKDLKDANISIKIEGEDENGEKVEINVNTDKKDDLVKQLEDLEGVNNDDTLKKDK